MLGRSPFKDAEKNPEPPERDATDYFLMTIGFIWFYRKIWIGAILIVGLWFIIQHFSTNKIDPVSIRSITGNKQRITKLPSVDIDDVVAAETVSETPESSDTDTKSGEQPAADKKAVNSRITTLLKTGSPNELIQMSLDIRDQWPKASPTFAFMLNKDRRRIARKLMEMELTDSQVTFAILSYIESVSILDSINTQHQFKANGVSEALAELDETFATSEEPAVAAKSNLALLLAPANRFNASGDAGELEDFNSQLANRLPKIAIDPASIKRLCQIMLTLQSKPNHGHLVEPIANKLIGQLQSFDNPDLENIIKLYRQDVRFMRFDLVSFVDRIEIDDELARQQVQSFFETLAANPDSTSIIFQVASDTIKSFQDQKKYEDAEALMGWLLIIAKDIPVKANEEAVVRAVEQLRKRSELLKRQQ